MYPKTPEELLEALTLQETNLPTYQDAIGATAGDLTENAHDRANLSAAMANQALVESNKTVVTQIKNAVYQGSSDSPVGVYPDFELTALPFPDATGGADARYRERRARFKTAKGYTKEIGIALGLEKATNSKLVSSVGLAAALKLTNLGDYQYQAEFKKHGQSAMLIQDRVKGAAAWHEAKTALVSPVTIIVTQIAGDNAAIQLEVRGRLLKGNQPVGDWSPVYQLIVSA